MTTPLPHRRIASPCSESVKLDDARNSEGRKSAKEREGWLVSGSEGEFGNGEMEILTEVSEGYRERE